ncbi:MAG: type I restriction enzyme HsdR N-terminal domain-containing protein [Candidatus Kapabacteria bacterium]|nr:type I restriction enzyme HsdR N-terminal domain-containing protein [Candidatus Kapabacteria bacterium]
MSDLVALPTLIFPTFETRISSDDGTLRIFDAVRKIHVALTPEEWVEKVLDKNGLRFDLLWMDADLKPFLLVECKSADVAINTDTLRQSAWYNITLRAPYVLLTNGRVAHCAHVDADGTVDLQDDVPTYPG